MDSDIEDNAIDLDEVNESFRRGVSLEGTMYLERVEKQAMESSTDSEERLIRIFDHLARKVDKGKANGISVLNEIERFGVSSGVILKLGHLFIETGQSSMATSCPLTPPDLENRRVSDRYDDDFDDYESDEFEEDEEEESTPSQMYKTISHPTPTYIEKDPITRASKSAPARSRGVGSLNFNDSPTNVGQSSKFRGTSFSWIKKGQWRKGEKIGSGSFGEVFQGMTDGGMLFAVKCLNFNQNIKEMNNLISEIELMQSLCHPNIVQYLGASVDEENGFVNIFQEWVPGGSIAHLLKRFGSFQVGVVRTYTRQILDGLQYLHSNGIVHRDIKGGNILVDDLGRVKLADFGASEKMKMEETQQTTEIKGTPYFMAPEVLSDSRYGRRGDVWALGCTIIQMLTGDPPWKDLKLQSIIQLHVHLTNLVGIPPVKNVDLPPPLKSFLELCFTKDHRKRPMVDELLEHPFVCLSDEELNDSMNSGNDDIVQQLNRAVARASINPNDTMGDIDRRLAERRRQRRTCDTSNSESKNDSISSSPAVSPPSTAITSPPSSHNPFAAKDKSSTSTPPRQEHKASYRYPDEAESAPRGGISSSQGPSRHNEQQEPPRRASKGPRQATRYSSRPQRRGSDSSGGSAGSYENGCDSTEITPRVVQEVGAGYRRAKSSSSKSSTRQKVLSESNEKRKHSATSGRKMVSSSSSAQVWPKAGESRRDRVRRPVTSSDTDRSTHGERREPLKKNPDERVVRQAPSDVYEQPQVYYDATGTGYNEYGEETGSWMCLNPNCGYITETSDINHCDECATIRGSTGLRGDDVRISVHKF